MSRFYAAIFRPQRRAFDQKYDGDVAKALAGAEVRITGKLQLCRGRPEIIIDHRDQMEVRKQK